MQQTGEGGMACTKPSRRKLQSLKSICQRIQKLRDGIRRVMAEQTEPATDVRSLRLNFQRRIGLSLDSENIHSPKAPPQINNIRSNPRIRNVMSMIEGSLITAAPPSPPPPPPPGSKPAVLPKPAVPDKNRRVSTGSIDNPSVGSEMKHGIGFRHTLIITDSPKKDGNGICDPPPLKYNRNPSTSTGPPLAQLSEAEDPLYEIADPPTAKQSPLPASSEAKNPLRQRKPSLPSSDDPAESDECYEIIDPSFTRGPLSSHRSPMAKPFIPEQAPSRPLQNDAEEYESIDPSVVIKSPPLASSSKNPASSPISRHFMHQQESSFSSSENPSDSEHHKSVPPSVSSNAIAFPRAKLKHNYLSVAKGPIHQELPKVSSHDTIDNLYETTDYIEPSNQNQHNVPVDKSPSVARNCHGEHGSVSEPGDLYDMPEDTSWNTQKEFGAHFQSSPANTNDGHLPSSSSVCDRSGDKKNLPPRLMGEKSSQSTEVAFSNSVPKRRHLSPAMLLGPPPPKPPRPPSVNLQLNPSRCPPQPKSEPVGSGHDDAYECPLTLPETSADVDETYADCVSDQMDQSGNLYEISSDPLDGSASEGCYKTATDGATVPSIRPHPHGNGNLGGQRRSQSMEEPRFRDVKIGKSEQALRKKYQITGSEIAIYSATVKKNVKGGKDMLTVTPGEMVEIIQNMGCPAGKWLTRNNQGNYGFVPLDAIGENQDLLNVSSCRQSLSGCYDDVVFGGTENQYSSFNDTEDPEGIYDDADSNVSLASSSSGSKFLKNIFKRDPKRKEDPVSSSATYVSDDQISDPYSSDLQHDSCNRDEADKNPTLKGFFWNAAKRDGKPSGQSKVFAKEEKIFRDKFKYTADIVVSNTAIVTEGAAVSPKGKYGLEVSPGDRLDVIDVSSNNLIICRNSAGKFGYVSIEHLQFVNQ